MLGSIPIGSTKIAEVAHSVEHDLAKVRVASSSLVFRSKADKMCSNCKIELIYYTLSGSSSFGRAVAFQASGGQFEPGLPLKWAC